MKRIAIIGGTGWDSNALKSTFPNGKTETISTRWGNASVLIHSLDDREIVFMHRHVSPESTRHLPPHRINYRANIAALRELQVDLILASSSVGTLRIDWPIGSFALVDQIIDFTNGRESTFHDEEAIHVDMTSPYDEQGKVLLRESAVKHETTLHENATYICTNGPRFETPAEIRMFATWGADVVGMTGMPEVALARELQIPYSAIAVITNPAAGIDPTTRTHEEVRIAMHRALPILTSIILDAAKSA
jgi:5'-methylthioadenosine phosphorylase